MARVVFVLAVVLAQFQQPARDSARTPARTATVSGVVVTDEASPRPLRRVHVALAAVDLRAPIASMTDDAGRFVLKGVPAGHYNVKASRAGYVETILGAAPGSILGAPIAVTDGQDVGGLTIRMPRGGVITGTVRLPSGRPATRAQIHVGAVKIVDGKRRGKFTMDVETSATDDRGVYRRFGLAPGDYLVQMVTSFDRQETRQTTGSEASWANRVAAAKASGPATPPAAGRSVVPAPIYYPGTADIAQARLVTVRPGEEITGIDFVADLVPTARLSGRVLDADGQPRAGIAVRISGQTGPSLMDMVGALAVRGAATDANGAFTIAAVAPGDYVLTTQAASAADAQKPAAVNEQPNLMAMMTGMFGGGGSMSLYASQAVTVAGQDLEHIELRLREGQTMSGTVVFEGTAERPAAGAVQVLLMAAGRSTSPVELAMSMMKGISATANADLSFTVRGIMPNRYRATVNLPGTMFGEILPGATWVVKSIRIGDGPDLADMPFEIAAGRDLSGVVVTLTDKPGVLTGKVFDGNGRPSSGFPIVVFSTDRAQWSMGSRRVQQARPASDGSYKLVGLPAGEYFVGAVTTLDLDDLYDPTFLEQIAPMAFRITLAEGETKQQDLKLGGK